LAITARLVEMQEGKLESESRPGGENLLLFLLLFWAIAPDEPPDGLAAPEPGSSADYVGEANAANGQLIPVATHVSGYEPLRCESTRTTPRKWRMNTSGCHN